MKTINELADLVNYKMAQWIDDGVDIEDIDMNDIADYQYAAYEILHWTGKDYLDVLERAFYLTDKD